jgi:hypothetical protein
MLESAASNANQYGYVDGFTILAGVNGAEASVTAI